MDNTETLRRWAHFGCVFLEFWFCIQEIYWEMLMHVCVQCIHECQNCSSAIFSPILTGQKKSMSIILSIAVKSFLEQTNYCICWNTQGTRTQGYRWDFSNELLLKNILIIFFFYSGSFSQISLYFFCSVHSNSSEFLAFAVKSTVRNEMREQEKSHRWSVTDEERNEMLQVCSKQFTQRRETDSILSLDLNVLDLWLYF